MIVCASAATHLVAPESGQHKEVAARVALGARRARLRRQPILETLILAC
jgi:hypothetical protein